MKKNRFLLIIIILLSNIYIGFSQSISNQTKLANSYFGSKDYDKAESIYKNLFKKTNSTYYYSRYIDCLCLQEKFKDAEHDIKKQIRKSRKKQNLYVELAYVYRKQNENEKADETLQNTINRIASRQSEIHTLASALLVRREYEYAVKVYNEAEKVTGKRYNREQASVYAYQKKYPEMINKYMDWAEEKYGNMKIVKSQLQYYVMNDIDSSFYKIMKRELLKRIQANDKSLINNNMLMWLYMQKKDFKHALVQAKAIDKKTYSSGRAIKNLAEMATINGDYDVAMDAWEYLILKGNDHVYHMDAKLGRLDILYRKIIGNIIYNEDEIREIKNEFIKTVDKLGVGQNTYKTIIKLAEIQAFYLNEPAKADEMLSKSAELNGLPRSISAIFKITRGDILAFQGDLWEATLLYAQVEKENKNNSTGDNAKLKKAFLAYYGHRYKWASAQFDALKKSTSKVVANDALKYSIFIKSQLESDSLHNALKLYSSAELLQFQKKKNEAMLTIDSLINMYPNDPIKPYAYFKKAEIAEQTQNWEMAKNYYKKIITEFADLPLTPTAVLNLGIIYQDRLDNLEEAKYYFNKLISDYKSSMHTNQAAKRIRIIRGE